VKTYQLVWKNPADGNDVSTHALKDSVVMETYLHSFLTSEVRDVSNSRPGYYYPQLCSPRLPFDVRFGEPITWRATVGSLFS
jgi:hypothetical protein